MTEEGTNPIELAASIADLQQAVAELRGQLEAVLQLSRETRSLVGPFGTPMPDGSMLVQTIHGTKYLIDPNDRVMAPQLIVYRQWEPDLSRLFLNSVNPDSVVIDVGANFGYFTCLAASRIGLTGRGQVWAFEPNPKLLPLLEDNCWRLNWSMAPVHVHPVAVGDHSGSVTLSVPKNGAANASLTSGDGDAENVEVEMVMLDDLVPPDLVVDLMKIDVEGHELAVLRGARRLIERSTNLDIVMEWSLGQLAAAGTDVAQVIDFIQSARLVPRHLTESCQFADAIAFAPSELGSIHYANIILTRA